MNLYPQSPGYKAAGTSAEAALSMHGRAGILRERILKVMRSTLAGWTTDEMAARLQESVLSVRPRFTELKAAGHIIATGQRRVNESGRNADVYVLREAQMRLL